MNDIVSRIKLFLTQMGIANSSFADVCGIPRPSLSQLLNGRNRKVSNEVIDKIHQAYPEINMMWLMFGDGEMLVPNANSSAVPQGDAEADFPGNAHAGQRDSHGQQSIRFDDEAPQSFAARKPKQAQPSAPPAGNALTAAIAAMTRGAGAKRDPQSAGGRSISNVIVVFTDGEIQVLP